MYPANVPILTGAERVFTLELPLREKVNKRDYEAINLNIYRNQHHYKRNNQKKSFHKRMKVPISKLPKLGKIWLHYEICPKTRRRLDTMNPGSVIDKFFSDSLVEYGIIEDDNYEYVVFNSFCFGSVEKDNPHCTVTIIELVENKETDMRILLDQDDIQKALNTYVEGQGIDGSTGVNLSVEEDGNITAEVMIGDSKPSDKGTNKPKRTRRTKAEIEAEKSKDSNDDTLAETDQSSSSGDDSGDSSSTEDNSVSESSEVKPPFDTEESDTRETSSKNPSEVSPEGSSTEAGENTTEESGIKVKKPKKGSIFDT